MRETVRRPCTVCAPARGRCRAQWLRAQRPWVRTLSTVPLRRLVWLGPGSENADDTNFVLSRGTGMNAEIGAERRHRQLA
eukprot:485068-Prymnesium_polylepis.1